ncbi:MAG TPA: AAA family ATPase [Firmicutes bacterium]|nr:AAA family ATPase [Bacillota bacterium]
MKIRGIYIDGFGVFRDLIISDLPDGLALFLGPNESGKSTLMEFVRTVLFGPAQGQDANRYPPLRGGTHGGRLEVVTDDGDLYIAQRINGRPSLRKGNGPSEVIEPASKLCPAVNRQIFTRVFAIGLDDMRGFEVLSGSGLGLLAASAGVDASGIAGALEYLEGKTSALLKPRSKKGEINSMLEKLEQIETALCDARTQSTEYARLQQRLGELRATICSLRTSIERATSRRTWIDALQRARQAWITIQSLALAQQRLSYVKDISANIASEHESLKSRLSAIQDELSDVEHQLEKLPERDAVLSVRDEIIEISSELARFREALEELPEMTGRLRQKEAALNRRLRDLGPGWNEEMLAQADLSMEAERECRSLAQQVKDAEREVEEVRKSLKEAQAKFTETEQAYRNARDQLEKRRASWPENLEQLSTVRELLVAFRERRKWEDPVHVLLPGLLILGSVGVILLTTETSGWVLGAVLVGVLLSIYLQTRSKSSSAKAALLQLRQLARGQSGPLAECLIEFCSRHRHTEGDFEELEERLKEASRLIEEARVSRSDVERAAAERSKALERLEDTKVKLKLAEEDVRNLHQAWQKWLASRGFSCSFSPEYADTVFQLAREAREAWHDLGSMRADLKRLQEYVEVLKRRIASVFEKIGEPIDPAQVSPRHVEELADRLRSAEEKEAYRSHLSEALDKKLRDLATVKAQLEQFYAKLGVKDEASFASLCEDAERWRSNQQEIEKAQRELHAIAGSHEVLSKLEETLRSVDFQNITAERAELEAELPRLEAKLEDALREEATCEARLAELASDEKLSRALAERQALALRIREAAEEWAAHVLCHALIAETKRVYERERQPAVLRTAAAYLDGIAKERYKLVEDIVSGTVELESENLSRRRECEWSRGMAEQVYLAVRLAFIEEFAREKEIPPVILDDVLVNCDPERQLAVCRVIASFAMKHQVLVFTCHPELADRLVAGATQAGYPWAIPCYRLKDGTLESVLEFAPNRR